MPNQTIGQVWSRNAGRVTLVPHPLVVGTNMVGVEIELEGVDRAGEFRSDYWEVKGDGSLRNNGHEFVFRGPTGGRDLYNALVEIDTFLNNRNPDGNWRCSTHVHVDVRDMTGQQLKHLTIIYTVLEKMLFRLSGIHRYKNNFCCALGFAQQQMKVLARAWAHNDTYGFTNALLGGWDKYSALNMLPLSGFGSVEFRLSEAKWRKGKLMLLCNRFLAMKELAMSWEGSEEDLIEHLVNSDVRELLPKGLPKDLYDTHREDIMVGYKLAYDLVTFAKNHPAIKFPGRNDPERAAGLWNEVANRGQTIPENLYVDNDSPVIEISMGTWEQIVQNFRNHHGIRISDEMGTHINAASIRWVLNLGGWGPNVLINDQDTREMYRQWCDLNPLEPARPRARANAPRPRANAGGNWFADADGGARDAALRRAMDAINARAPQRQVDFDDEVDDDEEAF